MEKGKNLGLYNAKFKTLYFVYDKKCNMARILPIGEFNVDKPDISMQIISYIKLFSQIGILKTQD